MTWITNRFFSWCEIGIKTMILLLLLMDTGAVRAQRNELVMATTFSGALNVKGALVSSPCILDTPEVNFPLQKDKGRYVLNLKVSRCGDGHSDIPERQSTEHGNIVVKQSAVLKTGKDQILLSAWRNGGLSRKNLQHGDNQITYYINEAQYQKIAKTQMPVTAHKTSDSNRGVMHLNIMYE
nr:pilus-assembly fibrillin subunit [Escherichia coli]